MEFMREMFLDEELESLSVIFSGIEDSTHHMPGGVGLSYETSSSFLSMDDTNMTSILPPFDESLFYNLSRNVGNDCNSNHFSQEDSPSSVIDGSFLPIQSYDQNCYLPTETNPNQFLKSMDSYMMSTDPNNNALSEPIFSNDVMDEILCVENVRNEETSIDEASLKRKIDVEESHLNSKPPKKKSRIPENQGKKSKENITSRKKKQKMIENDTSHNEEGKKGTICPSSSGYISEDDSNASQELNGGASLESPQTVAPKIKTRASRGAATDPQSLYARRRRERINERLRTLQNLVPNGTKVDISTMLEEAVHYVKFLQLQIKLLSSDDLWMFAPIAYNGMDIGLYKRLAPTL